MKTLSTSTNKTLRTIIASLTLSAAFFFGQTSFAQEVKFVDNAPVHTQTTDNFKVAIYPVTNAPSINVHMENPAREKITIMIKNNKDEVVYKKVVGREAIYYGKFDVSAVGSGTYTMVIQSPKLIYSNPFSIEASKQPIAKAF